MTLTPEYDEKMRDHDITLNLPEVQKQNWKTGPHRDQWDEPLDTIATNHTDRLVEAVKHDETFRQVAVVTIPEAEWRTFAQRLNREGLAFADTESTQVVHADPRRGLRSQTATMVVAADRDLADEVVAIHGEAGDVLDDPEAVRRLGHLAGYPDCCVDAYVERVLGDDRTDPIYEAAFASPSAETIDGDPTSVRVPDALGLLNVVWRYLDWHLIDFLPCTFECEAARERGVANGAVWRELGYGDEAEALWEFLDAPATWSGYHGLAHVRNGHSIGEYVTDDNWVEKEVVLKREHPPKAAVAEESPVEPGPADPEGGA